MSLRDFNNTPASDDPIALHNEPLGNGAGLSDFHTVSVEEREPSNTPKIVGGADAASTEMARLLYTEIVQRVVPVKSARAAEMAKLLENSFRSVNIALVNEMIHNARVVALDNRPHLPATVRLWNGDSRGRWEGNTLVVETTNFSDQVNMRGAGAGLHLIERFTRVAYNRSGCYKLTPDTPKS